jgi:glyceraldehyde 3-phosphate dehydrogenase
MIKYDSVYGGFKGKVEANEEKLVVDGEYVNTGKLIIDGKELIVFGKTKPEEIPWAKVDAEYIIESTVGDSVLKENEGG